MINKEDKFTGCLLGGAIGDALGYPVEFMYLPDIIRKYGSSGITDLEIDKNSRKALISDDTQMTIFTCDGLIWAYNRMMERGIGSYTASGVYQSYLRWYYTQTKKMPSKLDYEWLDKQAHESDISVLDYKELYVRRAPGNSCLSALSSGVMGTTTEEINNSKGCGGVMRIAPVGLLLHKNPDEAFKIGMDVAALTHGHPTGYLSAGVQSAIIAQIINGDTIINSINNALTILKLYPHHTEVLYTINKAISLVDLNINPDEAIPLIGEGWIAEEALGIALYCALKFTDFKEALIKSVNHSGDSDSTGAICGNIIGAYYGIDAIPIEWLEILELKNLITILSKKLCQLSN